MFQKFSKLISNLPQTFLKVVPKSQSPAQHPDFTPGLLWVWRVQQTSAGTHNFWLRTTSPVTNSVLLYSSLDIVYFEPGLAVGCFFVCHRKSITCQAYFLFADIPSQSWLSELWDCVWSSWKSWSEAALSSSLFRTHCRLCFLEILKDTHTCMYLYPANSSCHLISQRLLDETTQTGLSSLPMQWRFR